MKSNLYQVVLENQNFITTGANVDFYKKSGLNVKVVKELVYGLHYKLEYKNYNNLKSLHNGEYEIVFEEQYYKNAGLIGKGDSLCAKTFRLEKEWSFY